LCKSLNENKRNFLGILCLANASKFATTVVKYSNSRQILDWPIIGVLNGSLT